ncbi:LysR family transcriptional regulator [archaeon]|nr:MAG: LysR family transcriptional regulator [archaeon]
MQIYPRFKLWLEDAEGRFLLGEGTCELLEHIRSTGSLSDAARKSGISYAHAWKKIRKLERNLDTKLVDRSRGGSGGGSSTLTEDGLSLLERFKSIEERMNETIGRL